MMNDETKQWGIRILHDAAHGSSSQTSNSFDAGVFWSINVILITASLVVLVWCVCGGADRISRQVSSGRSSDHLYHQRIRERRLRQEQDKNETPELRRTKLLQSFYRNKVHSILQNGDFVEESFAENVENAGGEEAHGHALNAMETVMRVDNESKVHNMETSTPADEHDAALSAMEMGDANESTLQTMENGTAQEKHLQAMNDYDANESMVENMNTKVENLENESAQQDEHNVTMDPGEMHVETGKPGYIKLRTVGGKRTVPNCCAICLCTYEPSESIVWSSTKECPHAFHQECVVEWLIKMQDGTPCPCCRQEFTDLSL